MEIVAYAAAHGIYAPIVYFKINKYKIRLSIVIGFGVFFIASVSTLKKTVLSYFCLRNIHQSLELKLINIYSNKYESSKYFTCLWARVCICAGYFCVCSSTVNSEDEKVWGAEAVYYICVRQ